MRAKKIRICLRERVSAHFGKDAGLVWEELRTMLPPHEAAIYIQTCLKLEKPPTVRICDKWARRAKLRSMVREFGTSRERASEPREKDAAGAAT